MNDNLIQYLDPISMWTPINHGPHPQRFISQLQLGAQSLSLYHILLELYPEYKGDSTKALRDSQKKNSVELTSASPFDFPLDHISDL